MEDENTDVIIPSAPVPILSVAELEHYKSLAIEMRDRCVLGINDISMYRLLTHQYPFITRSVIADMEWWRTGVDVDVHSERYHKILSVLKELPASFAFVMSVRNVDCHQLRDEQILPLFFGDTCNEWIYSPETLETLPEEVKSQRYAYYEYMAYIVLNETEELAFGITHLF